MPNFRQIRGLLDGLHRRVGDLWWYSAMIFIACRFGDAIQAFIGLWLVPRYVGGEELGAVLPLQQLTSFLTVPLSVIAVVFAKFVSAYASRGEYGKVKCFIRDALAAALALFIPCTVAGWLVLPNFYERLRIQSGSLTVLILACGLAGNLSAVVAGCQQGLKRFRTISLLNAIFAPLRLATLLVAMPFRPLSGYLLGQTTPPAATAAIALADVRRTLRPYAADPSWRRDLPAVWRFLWRYALCAAAVNLAIVLNATVFRQRLPEAESAAYYLLSRFSDIAAFIGTSIATILFPLASEAFERGAENRKLLRHSLLGTLGGSFLLAAVFAVAAGPLLSLNSLWRPYLHFAGLLPLLTVNMGLGLAVGAIANYEVACNRFGASAVMAAASLLFAALTVSLTGCEFFRGMLPDSAVDFVSSLRIARLSVLTWMNTGFSAITLAAVALQSARSRARCTAAPGD